MANALKPISMRKAGLSLVLIALIVLTGCGTAVEPLTPSVGPSSTSEKPTVVEGPRISFDHESADLGKLPFNQMFHYYFPFRNVGNAPLEIIGEPTIETLEGC